MKNRDCVRTCYQKKVQFQICWRMLVVYMIPLRVDNEQQIAQIETQQ